MNCMWKPASSSTVPCCAKTASMNCCFTWRRRCWAMRKACSTCPPCRIWKASAAWPSMKSSRSVRICVSLPVFPEPSLPMFTGIVAAVGSIQTLTPLGSAADAGVRLLIAAGGLPLSDVALGDSIAINGACMTVVAKTDSQFEVDVSRESLNRTAGLDAPGEVNLEKALTLADRLGGHLVSGHVDGLGTVLRFEPVGESWELVVQAPRELGKYLAYKGSIVVNGVSLTVNRV